jgi:hypothetical protein
MAAIKENNSIPGEKVPVKHHIYESTSPKGIKTIFKTITSKQFMQIPSGIGGRVSIIPWYMAYTTSANGSRVPTPMVRLCVSNHLYVSDFGGGFSPEFTPYIGLVKELKDEVPLWKNYLINQLKNRTNLYIVLEQFNLNPDAFQPIPLMILIFVKVSAESLNTLGFVPTKEVRAVFDQTLQQFHERVDNMPYVGSTGIRMYHDLRKTGAVEKFLNLYFRSTDVSNIEIDEKELTNDKIHVTLYNGTTRPFSELIQNNSDFSNNLEEAWKIRKVYAKKQLMAKPSVALNGEKMEDNNGFSVISKLHKGKHTKWNNKSAKHHKSGKNRANKKNWRNRNNVTKKG